MMTQNNARLATLFRLVARWTAATVLVVGVLVLSGQSPEIAAGSRVNPELGTLEATTTLLFLLSGLSLWLAVGPSESRRRLYGRGCAMLVAVAGALAMGDALRAGGSLMLSERLAHAFDTIRVLFGGTMSPNGALDFVLLGSALFLLDFETSTSRRPSQLLAFAAVLTSFVAIVGYAYMIVPFYRVAEAPPLPFFTAISFVVLGGGTLAASSPERGLMRLVTSDSAGGYVIRCLPAAFVVGPLVLGWLTLTLQRANGWDAAVSLSIFVVMSTTFWTFVILGVASSLERADSKRRRAEYVLSVRASREAILANLGQWALSDIEPLQLMDEAATLVADTLQLEFCEVLGRSPDGPLSLLASTGWTAEDLGGACDETSHSIADYTLASGAPVVIDDLPHDSRFPGPPSERLRAVVSGLSVVVQGQARPLGVVTVYTKRRRAFTKGDTHFLQTVAALLGTTTDRKRAEADLRLSEEKFAKVFRSCPDSIGISTVAEGRFIDVNDSFLRLTGYRKHEIVGATSSELNLWLHSGDRVRLIEHARSGKAPFELEASFRTKAGEARMGLFSSELITLGGEECLLTLVHDISDRKRVEAMAEEANDQLRRWVVELERQTREISLLNEMSDLLHACVTLTEASSIIVRFAQQLFPDETGALYLQSRSDTLVEAVGAWGDLVQEDSCFAPSECWALRRGRPHVVADPSTGLVCPHVTETSPVPYACIPLSAQGTSLGVLHVRQPLGQLRVDTPGPIPIPDAKRRLMVTMAEHVGLALANLKLRETLRAQSIRDQLTGLFNRRYLEESLERELRRASRSRTPLGLILLDVDRLKYFNDTFGHEAGDKLLRVLSQFLQRRTREEDIICRLGGDEFVLVMPGASLATTQQRAEDLLREIRHIRVESRSQDPSAFSLSVGIAVFPEHAGSGQGLIRAADTALYLAKSGGRDRLEISQPVE